MTLEAHVRAASKRERRQRTHRDCDSLDQLHGHLLHSPNSPMGLVLESAVPTPREGHWGNYRGTPQ